MSKKLYNDDESQFISKDEQLAKVKGRIDENPTDPYSQHEIKSTGIPEESKSLIGEDLES